MKGYFRKRLLEPAWDDPEALLPTFARGNGLEFLVNPLMGQIESVGDAAHRLEANEGLPGAAGSIDDRGLITRSIDDLDLLLGAAHGKRRATQGIAHKPAEDMIEEQPVERQSGRIAEHVANGLRFAGWG